MQPSIHVRDERSTPMPTDASCRATRRSDPTTPLPCARQRRTDDEACPTQFRSASAHVTLPMGRMANDVYLSSYGAPADFSTPPICRHIVGDHGSGPVRPHEVIGVSDRIDRRTMSGPDRTAKSSHSGSSHRAARRTLHSASEENSHIWIISSMLPPSSTVQSRHIASSSCKEVAAREAMIRPSNLRAQRQLPSGGTISTVFRTTRSDIV